MYVCVCVCITGTIDLGGHGKFDGISTAPCAVGSGHSVEFLAVGQHW